MEEKLCPKCKKNPRHLNGAYCKECTKVYRHEWYEKNKDAILAYQRQYCKDNPDKIRERHKRYYAAHLEAVRKSQRNYSKRHPDKNRQKSSKQYWAKRNKPVTTTVPLRINLNVVQYSADKWYWTIHNNFTLLYAPVYYASRLEAWNAGRMALNNMRHAMLESNKRLLEDYEQYS